MKATKAKRGRANNELIPEGRLSARGKQNGKANDRVKPRSCEPSCATQAGVTKHAKPSRGVPQLCEELQALQRQRAVYIKSRIMVSNRLQAIVAGTLGYSSGMEEKARRKVFGEAAKLIAAIEKGTETESPLCGLVLTHTAGTGEFMRSQKAIEKEMRAAAKRLPVAGWVELPEQRGFGILFLAIVVGETGDLSGYANPAKVWRRLGCAPWTFDGQTLMGATWRGGKHGKLPAAEWESFGYSPRRRSIAFLIGEGLLKQNFLHDEQRSADGRNGQSEGCSGADRTVAGPYRLRYLEARATFAEKHPDYKPLRCHRHGMLCATKRLLRELWKEWRRSRV